jgi:acyl dehydratase
MKAGDKLPPLKKTFSSVDLFGYGAATWDWHRMHWDAELVRAKGFSAAVIDGQMYGGVFARVAMQWAGPRGFVTRLSLKMKSMAFAGDTLEATGTVSEIKGDTAILVQQLTKDSKVVAEATTHVRLPD